jgi:hypothetical protein
VLLDHLGGDLCQVVVPEPLREVAQQRQGGLYRFVFGIGLIEALGLNS